MIRRLILLLAMVTISSVYAEEETNQQLQGEWSISLAVGAGVITNPLVGGDNYPIVLAPSLKYYGEKFFFDNNTFGYTLKETNDWAFSLVTKENSNSAFFERWHTDNVLFSFGSDISMGIAPESPDTPPTHDIENSLPPAGNLTPSISLSDVEKRRRSLDAGMQLNWFISDTSDLMFSFYTDVFSAHNGQNAVVEWSKRFFIPEIKELMFSTTLGLSWQSDKLSNYYYGLSERDGVQKDMLYQPGATWSPYIKLFTQYKLSEQWKAVAAVSYKRLDDDLYLSPLVDESYSAVVFAGVRYDF